MKKFYLINFLLIALLVFSVSINADFFNAEYYEELGTGQDNFYFSPFISNERTLKDIPAGGVLLIPDSGQNRVMAFDPVTGDLIDENFIPPQNDHLTTPIHLILCGENESFLITDQVRDIVQRFSLDGEYIGIFAPEGGVDNSILDNIRGMLLRDNGNYLVTVASGANSNAIPEFGPEGNFLGNFIPAGSGGLNGPWSIIYREQFQDYLISANGSNAIHRYDSEGDFIELFVSSLNFPEQMQELPNGNILVATFSAPSGVYEFNSQGEQVGFYPPVTGLRGVYELGNGNILTTNSSGVYEINRDGQLVDTKITGVNARFITFITLNGQDGPDASISASDISFSPEFPEPGDTVQITARVHNIGNLPVTSGNADFYYSLEPDVDLHHIETFSFDTIAPSAYIDITVYWETDADMDPRNYVLTVNLTDIQPYDINPDNDTASIDIPLPVELAFFKATGFSGRIDIKWMTITETDNLGFNLYRLKGAFTGPYFSAVPQKINETLIPGQGTSSTPHIYQLTDHVEYGGHYLYILECISIFGVSTDEYRTRVEWVF